MAGGALARPAGTTTLRTQTEWFQRPEPSPEIKKSEQEIITRIESVSKKRGVSMAQVALAWMLHKDGAS
jgi:1-deoxyxylulose-5-phosphate synthase